MKTRLLIILIGIVILSTVPFVTIIVLDRYDNYLEQLEYDRLAIENQPKPGERSYIEPVLKAKLEKVELELREKVKELHEGLPPSSYAVNLSLQTKEIEVIIENKELIPKVKEFATKYPDDIIIVIEYGKFGFGELPFEIIDTVANKDEELPVIWCAYIGFDKYPQNLFDEFLESPYNKDVTFLNFIDTDLKKVPLFYELILESNQMEYPLNDRVSFSVSYEEYLDIKNYLKQRPYFEIKRSGNVIEDKIGTGHRTPQILIDDKLYRVNGLHFSPVFSDKNQILNVSYEWTLEEAKNNLFEDDNPNRATLIYFELNEKDILNLPLVKDAIDKLHTSDDKIRKSLDVGSTMQNKVQDFFKSENQKQFNGDESKYTKYFILNNTVYETSFVAC